MSPKFKSILVLLLVFVCGVGTGVIGTRLVVRGILKRVVANPDLVRQRIERELNSGLKLTADQQPKVHDILVRSHQRVSELRSEYEPRFFTIIDEGEKDITAVLTPEQQEKFRKYTEEKRPYWRPPSPKK